MNPNTDKIQMVLHEKPKLFTHNTISQAERWACLGRYGTSVEGESAESFIIVEAVRCNGLLFLQTGPVEQGLPALN